MKEEKSNEIYYLCILPFGSTQELTREEKPTVRIVILVSKDLPHWIGYQ